MTIISEEDVQAIATHTNNLKAVARDVRRALAVYDGSGSPGRNPTQIQACAIHGCERQSYAFGYCFKHYAKRRRYAAKGMMPAEWVKDALPGTVQDVNGWDLKAAKDKEGAQ